MPYIMLFSHIFFNCLRRIHFTDFKEKVIHMIIYNEDFIMESLKHVNEENKIMKPSWAQLQQISTVVLHHSPSPPCYSEAILIAYHFK